MHTNKVFFTVTSMELLWLAVFTNVSQQVLIDESKLKVFVSAVIVTLGKHIMR